MKRCFLPILLAVGSSYCHAHPADVWEVAVESGYLEQVGSNTPLDYTIVSTQVVFRAPTMWNLWEGDSGARFLVRNRFAFTGEWFETGAEDYYLGLSAAPSIEFWFPDKRTAIFGGAGGGFGLTNSGDVVGGQGQDFTLNWFAQLGLRYEIRPGVSLLGSAFFVHHSNGGMTDPNPGIDALGGVIGISWAF